MKLQQCKQTKKRTGVKNKKWTENVNEFFRRESEETFLNFGFLKFLKIAFIDSGSLQFHTLFHTASHKL
jgi:hypothetical protein